MIEKWVYALLENVLKPLVKDIHKILTQTLKLGIKKKDFLTMVETIVKSETDRVCINAVLYLLMTIIICLTVWRFYALW